MMYLAMYISIAMSLYVGLLILDGVTDSRLSRWIYNRTTDWDSLEFFNWPLFFYSSPKIVSILWPLAFVWIPCVSIPTSSVWWLAGQAAKCQEKLADWYANRTKKMTPEEFFRNLGRKVRK